MSWVRNLSLLLLATRGVLTGHAQQDVRAWYADGHVWVVWRDDTHASPPTFAIHRSASPFDQISDATLRGRLFPREASGANLKAQSAAAYGTNVLEGFRIPDGAGAQYELAPDEGLFVDTARETGAAYYSVTPFGQATVLPGQRTLEPVGYRWHPGEPPRLHLQHQAINPDGYLVSCHMMWVDGDADEQAGRMGFPVMANAARHGAPHLCFAVTSTNTPAALPAPATLLLHGETSRAADWLPSPNRPTRFINIDPAGGLLIVPDDTLNRLMNGGLSRSGTRWFGWARGFDPFRDVAFTNGLPFAPSILPEDTDTIVPYTQRRLLWILDQLIAEGSVDGARVSLMGHGDGATGALALAKAHPDRFGSVTLFNAGLQAPSRGELVTLLGTAGQNLATTLHRVDVRQPGVPINDVWTLIHPLTPFRDLPFLRLYQGKADVNPSSAWTTEGLEQVRLADRLGWGLHFYWDRRGHDLESWDDHWVRQSDPEAQTRRDDAASQFRYAGPQSFPAFCNLQDHPGHGDPGTGQPDTGDHHGTWGGWFDWDPGTLVDETQQWACTLYLTGLSAAVVDYCPADTLMADVALRKAEAFRPVPGRQLNWRVERVADGSVLQAGAILVQTNGLVMIPAVRLSRDPGRVRLVVEDAQSKIYDTLVLTEPVKGPSGRFRFDVINAPVQAPFIPEASTNLIDWSDLATEAPLQSPHRVRDGGAIDEPKRLYRVRRGGLVTDPTPTSPGLHSLKFAGPRHQRRCLLYIPTNQMNQAGLPVCLLFHEAGQTAAQFVAARASWLALAEANGMVAAFPEGIISHQDPAPHWITQDPPWEDNAPDDVGFVLGLIDHLRAGLPVDAARLYAAGFGEGGRLVHLLAGRNEGVFAAFATVASTAGWQDRPGDRATFPPLPAQPVNLLAMAGVLDARVPFHGGPNDQGQWVEAQSSWAGRLLRAHACKVAAERNLLTGGDGMIETYTLCGEELRLIRLEHMAHQWPEAADGLGVDANQAIMDFFNRH